MRVTRLDHLVLTVRSLEATVDFYTAVLGLRLRAFDGGRLALRFGDQQLDLHEAGQQPEPAARTPLPGAADLCFVVEGPLDDWLDHLDELRVPIVAGPSTRPGTLGPMTSLTVRDPDGNLVELAAYG
jgi:catechol 2,3-dioxygenase-like lactoylglutathione lyase family enzyme